MVSPAVVPAYCRGKVSSGKYRRGNPDRAREFAEMGRQH